MSASADIAFCESAFARALRAAARTTCFLVRFTFTRRGFAFVRERARFTTRFLAAFLTLFFFFLVVFLAM
jgi:hypothetical protein